MATTTDLTTIIAQCNAWADYLDTHGKLQRALHPQRNIDLYTLRSQSYAVQQQIYPWKVLERLDATHTLMEAPAGIRVIYEHGGLANRLTLTE